MKRSEMLKLLKKKKKEYIGCCKKVDYDKLLKIIEKAGMLPPNFHISDDYELYTGWEKEDE